MLANFSWNSLFENLPGILCITLIFGGWVIVAVVRSFTDNWRKVRQSEQAAALKQSMLDKGMSAADIERIIKAEEEAKRAADLKEVMVENGMSPDDIERVLKAGNSKAE